MRWVWWICRELSAIWWYVLPECLIMLGGAWMMLGWLGVWNQVPDECCLRSDILLRWALVVGYVALPASAVLLTIAGLVWPARD